MRMFPESEMYNKVGGEFSKFTMGPFLLSYIIPEAFTLTDFTDGYSYCVYALQQKSVATGKVDYNSIQNVNVRHQWLEGALLNKYINPKQVINCSFSSKGDKHKAKFKEASAYPLKELDGGFSELIK